MKDNFKTRFTRFAVASSLLSLTVLPQANAAADAAPDKFGSTQNLPGVIEYVFQSNPDILIAQRIRNASNETVNQAKAGYLPTVDANAGYGREYSKNSTTDEDRTYLWRNELGIEARENVFRGFGTMSEVHRTRAQTDAASYKVQGVANDISVDVASAYFNVLRDRELVEIAQVTLDKYLGVYKIIKERGDRGLGRQSDVVQADGRVAFARANLVSAQSSLQDDISSFYRLTNLYPAKKMLMPAIPKTSELPKSESEAIDAAIKSHPTLKSASADVIEAQQQNKSAKSKYYPEVDLVLRGKDDYNTDGAKGDDDSAAAMVQMRYNLFNGGADLARDRETAYQYQQSMDVRNKTYREVVENMRLSWNSLVQSQGQLPYLKTHWESATEVVYAYLDQYKIGKRTLLDLLDVENERFISQQRYVNTKYARMVATYRVLGAQGKLIQYLNIALPQEATPQYDTLREIA